MCYYRDICDTSNINGDIINDGASGKEMNKRGVACGVNITPSCQCTYLPKATPSTAARAPLNTSTALLMQGVRRSPLLAAIGLRVMSYRSVGCGCLLYLCVGTRMDDCVLKSIQLIISNKVIYKVFKLYTICYIQNFAQYFHYCINYLHNMHMYIR